MVAYSFALVKSQQLNQKSFKLKIDKLFYSCSYKLGTLIQNIVPIKNTTTAIIVVALKLAVNWGWQLAVRLWEYKALKRFTVL